MDQLKHALNKVQPGAVVIVGVPFDDHSTFLKGAALAPQRIREALHSPSSNMCTENIKDLSLEQQLVDIGDLVIKDYIHDIEHPVSRILEKDAFVLSLGGDHAITYPILKSYAKKHKLLNILQLDAHPDLYNEYEGNPFSHACPFARIMEEKLAARLVQVGIRTMNPHLKVQAERFNVETIDMKSWDSSINLIFNGPVYISLDMDVLDPAFAPGVSHAEPGGFSTREVLGIIQDLEAPVVGADIVELNPGRDINGITAAAAAKFLKEIVEKMIIPG
jgi:arginase